MVIYPKESVLKYYEGTSSSEIAINSGQIQPLIIKDLVIKAKKNWGFPHDIMNLSNIY